MRGQRAVALAAAGALLLLPSACGSKESDGGSDLSSAADTSTCVSGASQVSDFPAGYPQDFPLPHGTVLFHVEDRGADGVIATGVTSTAFQDVLAELNGPAQQAGYKVTSGETEDHDAEANWTGNGYTGRWAIRESSSCPGETVVQLLSKKA